MIINAVVAFYSYLFLFILCVMRTSDSSLKNSWAAHGPGNLNRLEVVVIHETNISKISSTPKDPSLMK